MQLQEILELLKVTPIHYNVAMTVVFILAVIFFIAIFKYDTGQDDKKLIASLASMIVFLITGLGLLIYTQSASKTAIEEAKISRVNDKIHIESNSEFMRSADLDVVVEKDGYIYVEFENKTYRIEDLSKKGN